MELVHGKEINSHGSERECRGDDGFFVRRKLEFPQNRERYENSAEVENHVDDGGGGLGRVSVPTRALDVYWIPAVAYWSTKYKI